MQAFPGFRLLRQNQADGNRKFLQQDVWWIIETAALDDK
jgi:hypothetical protein